MHVQDRLQFAMPFSFDDILFHSGDIRDHFAKLSEIWFIVELDEN